ncbi:uncharacterized protein LACBIDRAFT_313045 [Laccaria bicolor S238N-H82]|uniref:Predicted protein n=1 Tax=Laccaria bicolor (strain S238N-H82 / ATCC MYA-4686) TaxID=486041 RepID=B0CT04_LACBS|nr:uncharacterized protein LACBIDRAFT_304949 [Laccaria bicolor S238N-H82]XP_001891279.1 uncharacterized protein LACBIDRAFT_313045 [Laccaria bicolor S238N-H82]EDQ98070.1 predicted protein [Laccaria bicolor S238N-H82]EDR13852.1 predicted protein [Laccaria bicolor S238N-H82]|eukprot:XP_001874411.1 predicted protein [Laccaria bicolor S238N-H82]
MQRGRKEGRKGAAVGGKFSCLMECECKIEDCQTGGYHFYDKTKAIACRAVCISPQVL